MKIAVYTSITAEKDSLKDPPADRAGVDFVLFSDRPFSRSGWDGRPACELFVDPRRNSRAPKFLAHQYLPGYDYSIWIDGSVRLLVPAHELVDGHLGQADIALFPHPDRDCAYAEAQVCAERGLDDPAVIAHQMAAYARDGYPLNNGLTENRVILRRHCPQIEALNNAWWSEYCRHSCRDQLSLNYLLRKFDIRAALFPGTVDHNPGLVAYDGHLR